MKLKGLLHLYNDGHEPFGRGGLGYHPIRMSGSAIVKNKLYDGSYEFIDDKNDDDKRLWIYDEGQKKLVSDELDPKEFTTLKDSLQSELSMITDIFDATKFNSLLDQQTQEALITKYDVVDTASNSIVIPSLDKLNIFKTTPKIVGIDKSGKDKIVDYKSVDLDKITEANIDDVKQTLLQRYIDAGNIEGVNSTNFLDDDVYALITPKERKRCKFYSIFYIQSLYKEYLMDKDKTKLDNVNRLIQKYNNTYGKERSSGGLSEVDIHDGDIKFKSKELIQKVVKRGKDKGKVKVVGVNSTTEEPSSSLKSELKVQPNAGIDYKGLIYEEDIQPIIEFNDKMDEAKTAFEFEDKLCELSPQIYGVKVENSKVFLKDIVDKHITPKLQLIYTFMEEHNKKPKKMKDLKELISSIELTDKGITFDDIQDIYKSMLQKEKEGKLLNLMDDSYCHDAMSNNPNSDIGLIVEFKDYYEFDLEYAVNTNQKLKVDFYSELLRTSPNSPLLNDEELFNKEFYRTRPYMGIPITLNKFFLQKKSSEHVLINKEGDTQQIIKLKFKKQHAIKNIEQSKYQPQFTADKFITGTNYMMRGNRDILNILANKYITQKFEDKKYKFDITVRNKFFTSTYSYTDDKYIDSSDEVFKYYQPSHIYDNRTSNSDEDFCAVLIPAEQFKNHIINKSSKGKLKYNTSEFITLSFDEIKSKARKINRRKLKAEDIIDI